jgi:hypothetical protein
LSEFDLRALLEATAGGRPFDPATDIGVIRRGGNVTGATRFGALDVVQRAQSRTQDLLDLENLPEED